MFSQSGNRLFGFLFSGAIVAILAACAGTPDKKEAAPRNIQTYWPNPPDQPRFVFEYLLRDSKSIPGKETDTDAMRRLALGDDIVIALKKPYGVAARRGRIYVSDTEARAIHVFDVPRRKFFSFGLRFEGTLKKPLGLAADQRGRVYVADASRQQVVVFDSMGLFLMTVGNPAELERPTSVAVDQGGERIYVVDTGGVESDNHRIVVYDRHGAKLFSFGTRGQRAGEFNLPVDAAVAPDGTLYVLDAGNFRVQAFDPMGKPLRSFGEVGAGFGQFSRPRGIGVDTAGNVYVTDATFGNVQIFNANGALLMPLGGRGGSDGPATYRLPAGVTSDETGRLYVVDQYFSKVEVFRSLSDEEGKRIVTKSR